MNKTFLHWLQKIVPKSRSIQVLLGAFFVAFLLINTRTEEPPSQPREQAWLVDVLGVKQESIRPTLDLFGQVESPEDANLSAGIEAVVDEMLVRDGEAVSKGELLVVLDDRDTKLTLMQYEADLKEAMAQEKLATKRLARAKQDFKKEQELMAITQKRYERSRNLAEQGVLSQSDFDASTENLTRQELAVSDAEFKVDETEAELIQLEAKLIRFTALRDKAAIDLERTKILAPFDGVISDVAISIGDRVRNGDQLLRIQNPNSLEIRAQIPTRYAFGVRDSLIGGMLVPVVVKMSSGDFSGNIVRVSGQTREGSGGVDGYVGFQKAPLGLSLGSTVRVKVELPPQSDVIAVPAEAIYGNDQLFKLTDGRMQMIEVDRVGERGLDDGRTLVLVRSEQLNDEDQIVVTKLSNAANGLLVKVSTVLDQAVASDPRKKLDQDNSDLAKVVQPTP